MIGDVGLSGPQYGVQHVDASAGQGDDGLVVAFALGSFPVVEGAAGRVALQGAERGLVEDPFEGAVAAGSASLVAGFAGLDEGGCQAGRGGELVAGGESGGAARFCQEFGGQGGPHPGQATDEGRIGVAFERRLDLFVQFRQPGSGRQAFTGQFPHDLRGDRFAGHGDVLGLRGGQGGLHERVDARGAQARQRCANTR